MSHTRNDSVSSIASVASYDSLKSEIDNIGSSDITLKELVAHAEGLIADFHLNPKHIFEHGSQRKRRTLELDLVMTAMLATAEECGGEKGKRYVASAIIACERNSDGTHSKFDLLRDLGITWVTHLLFIFKTSHGHGNQHNSTPSAQATPSLEATSGLMVQAIGTRSDTFRDHVLLRDGYRCVVTDLPDRSHPLAGEYGIHNTAKLQAAHILRRAVANFDQDKSSASYISALTTFDILRHYSRITDETLQDLEGHIDHESNGIALELSIHELFDEFLFSLTPTEKENVYNLKYFGGPPVTLVRMCEGGLQAPIEFRDRSAETRPSPSGNKRAREYELPNPHLLSIHAAIGGVLHMSGAGKFFDDLLSPPDDPSGNVPPLRCWSEYERWIGTERLRDDLTAVVKVL